jgi:hypothetical protein
MKYSTPQQRHAALLELLSGHIEWAQEIQRERDSRPLMSVQAAMESTLRMIEVEQHAINQHEETAARMAGYSIMFRDAVDGDSEQPRA